MKQNHSWDEIVQVLQRHQEFIVVGHSIPDGDCVGSVAGLYLGLVTLGKRVVAVLEDEIPCAYHFLSGVTKIMQPHQIEEWPRQVIYLDCADAERPGEVLAPLLAGCNVSINIDHHVSNSFFGVYNRVEPEKASTAELVLELLQRLEVEITPAIATAIYVGMVTDTGCFQYGSTTPATLRTAAWLLESGVDIDQVRINLYESRPRQEVGLLQRALASLQLTADGKIASMLITYHDLVELDALQHHYEGLINHARSIAGVEVGMLFREIEPGVVKIGFRSKQSVDVNQIAARLGGGGHPRAAGAQIEGDIREIHDRVVGVVASCMDS